MQDARRIKFVPAIRDGKPVSMIMQLEYSFSFWIALRVAVISCGHPSLAPSFPRV